MALRGSYFDDGINPEGGVPVAFASMTPVGSPQPKLEGDGSQVTEVGGDDQRAQGTEGKPGDEHDGEVGGRRLDDLACAGGHVGNGIRAGRVCNR